MGGRKKINKTEVSFGRKIFLFFLFKKDKKTNRTLARSKKKKKKNTSCVYKNIHM